MTTQPDGPADTRMVRIVHQALRRDLRRAQVALTRVPPPPLEQSQAIAHHMRWMMQFLREHHRAEDEGFYPLVRERDHAAAALLDAMDADHESVASAIVAVDAAAAALGNGETSDPNSLVNALESLTLCLLPHLQREEDEMMPVVSAAITNKEWRAIEYEHSLRPKSFVELGREAHWLIDNATSADREAVLGLVPPVPRFVLLYGLARSYRRRAVRCWAPWPRPERRVQKSGRCAVVVDAQIDAVWQVVEDVTRVGQWSHECVSVTWLDGATAAVPGARFRGRNRAGIFRWGRVCEIVSAEPYALVWRTVSTARYPDSSEWTICLEAEEGGTRIEQTFRVIRAPKLLDIIYALMIPAHRDRTAALTEDLRRLGNSAAGSIPATAPASR